VLYRASHAVLANSGHEPFGLVGLEVMAAQGLAFVGSTGEDYAQHLLNAISMDTNDPNEVVGNLLYLQHHTRVAEELRRVGRITARFYVWPRIIGKLVSKLQYLLMTGGITWPRKDIGP
jgi:glycosyltransferase involved in cell wall biosynthesis